MYNKSNNISIAKCPGVPNLGLINAKTIVCLNDQILNDHIIIFMNIDDTMSILRKILEN